MFDGINELSSLKIPRLAARRTCCYFFLGCPSDHLIRDGWEVTNDEKAMDFHWAKNGYLVEVQLLMK